MSMSLREMNKDLNGVANHFFPMHKFLEEKKIVIILIEDEQATEDGESVNILEEEEFSRARWIF